VAAALLSGCMTFQNLADPVKITEAQMSGKLGIIVLSTGAFQNCIATATYLKIMPSTASFSSSSTASLFVDASTVKSDFTDHYGNLHAFAIPAGKYYIAPGIANNVIAIQRHKADFSVDAGETVYLGEYFMTRSCALETLAELRDMRVRDMALLALRNPNLAKKPISYRILEFTR
jgi:hypothetical protein